MSSLHNPTAILINRVVDSFKHNIIGVPNTNYTRSEELKDCDMSFEAGFKMANLSQMYQCYKHKIFENSFSECERIEDEVNRVSLTDVFRQIR